MLDVNEVKKAAEAELVEEASKAAKEKIKSKMRELERARQIVRNVEREINELYADIGAGLTDTK